MCTIDSLGYTIIENSLKRLQDVKELGKIQIETPYDVAEIGVDVSNFNSRTCKNLVKIRIRICSLFFLC